MPELATQGGRIDVVDERPLSIDFDDWQPLPVKGLELGDSCDVYFFEFEPQVSTRGLDRLPRSLAEVAALGVVENDPGGYG